jgi:Putative Flp pilus-assembly TadE/G-like
MLARIREERGSALVLFAVTAPMFILFLALALDVGNWYTHKRQLQNRADAGAFAAAVQYEQSWAACVSGGAGTAVATAISNAAKDYSGRVYNKEVAGTTAVNINASAFGAADDSDGGDPCFKHPANAADWISPTGGYWTDVKVKETNIPTFFGTFGINVPAIIARARVQINPAESDNRFIPLGIPTPEIDHVEARFYNLCNRNSPVQIGTPYYLAPMAAQTVAGVQVWGWSPSASSNAKWTTTSTDPAIGLQMPARTTCAGMDYIPVGVEIRVAGKTSPGIDLDSTDCATLSAMRYADCFTDLTEIRVWNGKPPTYPNPPEVEDVRLSNTSCNPDSYFTRTASCGTQQATVNILWGAARLDPVNLSHATYTVSLNGSALTPPADWQNGWTGSVGVTGAGGATPVTLSWSWQDTDKNDSFQGQACKNGGSNPCSDSGQVQVQRTFTANDQNAGPVQFVQVRRTNAMGPTADIYDSQMADAAPTVHNIYLAVGLTPPFSARGPLVTLRASQSTNSQSLDCNNDNNGGSVRDMFANGCKPFYTSNDFSSNTWWPCPKPSSFPGTNTDTNPDPSNPYECVPVINGLTPSTIADGMAIRTGNCSSVQANLTCNQTSCMHPNGYANYIDPTKNDPNAQYRIVKLFVMPYGAFKNVNIGQESLPVLDFAAFYVTGWGGQGASNNDPCAGDDPALAGEVVGHFFEFVGPNDAPPDPNAQCVVGQIRPCEATLVR